MAGLRLVSVNIERSKHLDRVIPFLHTENPDVVCMQELNEWDVEHFKKELSMEVSYVPLGINPKEQHHPDGPGVIGIGIFSRSIISATTYFYRGRAENGRVSVHHLLQNLALLVCEIKHEDTIFRVITTHFTWTPDGLPTELQRTDCTHMLESLESIDQFILCGDFNAPRGGEIFTRIANRYTDTIPPEYISSIDGDLHRAGPLPYMVDGLFSTPEYVVSGVRLQNAVSDHCAIVARIEKR